MDQYRNPEFGPNRNNEGVTGSSSDSSSESEDNKKKNKKVTGAPELPPTEQKGWFGVQKKPKEEIESPSLFSFEKDEEKESEEKEKNSNSEDENIEAHEEIDSSLEHLTPEEVVFVAQDYIDTRSKDIIIELEQAEEGTATAEAAKADKEFLEKLEENLNAGMPDITILIETAGTETLHNLTRALPYSTMEKEAEPEESPNESPIALPAEAPAISIEDILEQAEDDLDELSANTPPDSPSSGGAGAPPLPPGDRGPYMGSFPDRPSAPLTWTDTNPVEIIPPRKGRDSSELDIRKIRHHEFTKGLFVGGVVGYLFGRRRGRLQAEKRSEEQIAKIQDTLQNEVVALQKTIANKEREIRHTAAQRVAEQIHAKPASTQIESTAATQGEKSRLNITGERSRQEAPLPERARETVGTAPLVPVAETLTIEDPVKKEKTTKPSSALPIQRAETLSPHQIETMSTSEVIELADTIKVSGNNLKKLYESGKLTEPALRRVVAEYVRTGHAERWLSSELTSVEKQRGREQAFSNSESRHEVRATANDHLWNITSQYNAARDSRVDQLSSSATQDKNESTSAESFVPALVVAFLIVLFALWYFFTH